MQRKYIHYGHPEIVAIYYREEDVYVENLDCKGGKVIIMVPGRKKKNRAVRKV